MGITIRERLRWARRGFTLGPAVVQQHDATWGKDTGTFTPTEYGDYLATSNAVYSCATLRARLLAAMPLRLYLTDRAGDRTEVKKGDLYSLLHKVNPFWTVKRLLNMTEMSLCAWGKAYWFLERGKTGKGRPREIWWGRPDKVRVVPDPVNYIRGYWYEPGTGAKPIWYNSGEVIAFRYPNPIDEYEGLSPLAAARLSADTSSAALKSNRNLFSQGMQMGGTVMPGKDQQSWTKEQQGEMTGLLNEEHKGVSNAHRWGVFRFPVQITPLDMLHPRDAEFLGTLKWTLEEVCRAYGVPLDLLGGQRAYANVESARKVVYEQTILPEAEFICSEIQEQLLPMFTGVDELEFDHSGVSVLQPDETAQWGRSGDQIAKGAITINEWRAEQGLDPVLWGDAWWAPMGATPVAEMPEERPETPEEAESPEEAEEAPEEEAERQVHTVGTIRAIEFGSAEHTRIWNRFVRRTERWEGRIYDLVADLFKRQRDSVLAKLEKSEASMPERGAGVGSQRGVLDVMRDVFNKSQWIKVFRESVRSTLTAVARFFGDEALDELMLDMAFDVGQPSIVRFLEQRAQRFAKEVNDTTWDALKRTLGEGIDAGESMEELVERTENLFTGWYRKTKDQEMLAKATRSWVIARTEVVGASNGGMLEAWKQSDVVESKIWLSALIETTRDSHALAHGQTVGLDEDFVIGDGQGPAPGQIGIAGEDINCLCTMTAGIKF